MKKFLGTMAVLSVVCLVGTAHAVDRAATKFSAASRPKSAEKSQRCGQKLFHPAHRADALHVRVDVNAAFFP